MDELGAERAGGQGGAGGFLTRTTNAGMNAVVLALEDVGHFSDGDGLVAGDRIQLENRTATKMITAVDEGATTVTLEVPLTWAAGTGVALPYFGTRPEQGTFESDSSVRGSRRCAGR